MKWFRLIVGWMLVAIACAIVVIIAIVAIDEARQPQEKQTPAIAFLIGGTIFGVCPAFLGWTLLRRRVPSLVPQSVPTASSAADQVSPAVEAQSIPVVRGDIHRLSDDAYRHQRWRNILRYGILMSAAGAAGLFLNHRHNEPMNIGVLGVSIILFVAASICGWLLATRRIRATLSSYELEVAETVITRRMVDRSDIVLPRDAVKSIDEGPDGSLIVRGPSVNQSIGIPFNLIGLSSVRSMLATWRPITKRPVLQPNPWLTMLIALSSLVLYALPFNTDQPGIAVPAAFIEMLFLTWCFWYIQRSNHIDGRIRRWSWWLIFPACPLVLRAYMLLFHDRPGERMPPGTRMERPDPSVAYCSK